MLGYRHAIFQRDTFDGNERDHIGSAHAWMRPLVLGEIDQLGGFADTAYRSFRNGIAVADESDDATVVVGVHFTVKEKDTLDLHGFYDGIDNGLVSAFRKIGNTFN